MPKKDAAPEPAYLSVTQVAEQLNVTTRTVERMVKRGEFPGAYKLPGETAPYLIPREAVERYLEKKRQQSKD
jgi:excisionase family DNA binding protein